MVERYTLFYLSLKKLRCFPLNHSDIYGKSQGMRGKQPGVLRQDYLYAILRVAMATILPTMTGGIS